MVTEFARRFFRIPKTPQDNENNHIRLNRPPRVHITYEDPYNAGEQTDLPFVTGVLTDLSGNDPGEEKPEVGDRKLMEINRDNFDSRMAAIKPGVSLDVKNTLSGNPGERMKVKLRFEKMDDFKPTAVVRQIPAMAKLLEAREQLRNLQLYMDGKADAEANLRTLLKDPKLMAALREKATETEGQPG